MDEALKRIMAQTGRSLAGEAFKNAANSMQNFRVPTLEERMEFSSAAQTISSIAEEIRAWKERTPQNYHLVVTLRTPDGRVMDVETLKAAAFQTFTAEGNIMGLPCMIAGHIATLALLCSYEETKGKSRAGFTVLLSELATEPPPTPEQTPGDTR